MLLLCLISAAQATAQERAHGDKPTTQGPDNRKTGGGQIEVKTNRFNNETTVTLKPQALIENGETLLTMEIEAKLGKKGADKERVIASFTLELQSKSPRFAAGAELNFLVNGQPLSAGKADFNLDGTADISGKLKSGFTSREYSNPLLFNRRALEQLSQADHIEMQLGAIETELSKTVVTTLREYATRVLEEQKAPKDGKQ
jgi:hypothetical protein